jgi:putative membrane protein
VTFFILAKLFPEIEKRIEDNCVASGVFVGGVSLGIGILQAACMVP